MRPHMLSKTRPPMTAPIIIPVILAGEAPALSVPVLTVEEGAAPLSVLMSTLDEIEYTRWRRLKLTILEQQDSHLSYWPGRYQSGLLKELWNRGLSKRLYKIDLHCVRQSMPTMLRALVPVNWHCRRDYRRLYAKEPIRTPSVVSCKIKLPQSIVHS